MSIKKTNWYHRLRRELKNKQISQEFFDECVREASNVSEVVVYGTDETGDYVWAISTPDGFWLDIAKSEEQAMQICRETGWQIEEKKKCQLTKQK